jgi:serine/threonine protein phosphatase 1
VQQLIELPTRCDAILIRGNHDEMLLSALESESDLRCGLNSGYEETLNSYPYRGGDEFIDSIHVQFLKANCRDFHGHDDFIFVHAFYDPNKPMAQQSRSTLQLEHVHPEKMHRHYSGKIVMAWHTRPQTSGEILDFGFLKVIDTDCRRGGWLTAFARIHPRLLQANEIGQVRRRRTSKGM